MNIAQKYVEMYRNQKDSNSKKKVKKQIQSIENQIRNCKICYVKSIMFGKRIKLDLYFQNRQILVESVDYDDYYDYYIENWELFDTLYERKNRIVKCDLEAKMDGTDLKVPCSQWYCLDQKHNLQMLEFCEEHSFFDSNICERCKLLTQMQSSCCLKCATPILYINSTTKILQHNYIYCSICCTEFCFAHKSYLSVLPEISCQQSSIYMNQMVPAFYYFLYWILMVLISISSTDKTIEGITQPLIFIFILTYLLPIAYAFYEQFKIDLWLCIFPSTMTIYYTKILFISETSKQGFFLKNLVICLNQMILIMGYDTLEQIKENKIIFQIVYLISVIFFNLQLLQFIWEV